MKGSNVDLRKAVLYGVSGGFLTALFGTLGAGIAQAAPPPPLVKPLGQKVHDKVAKATKTPVPVSSSRPSPTPSPAPAKAKSSAKDKGNEKNTRADGRVASDDGRRNANNGVKQPDKSKILGPPTAPPATKVPTLDKKFLDQFNAVVRRTMPGAAPRIPESAGGGGVAVSDPLGEARRTKVGGSAAVSDQVGEGRRAADDVARKARLADTAARNKKVKDAQAADDAARKKAGAKLEAKLRDDPNGEKAKAAAAAKRNAERLAYEKRQKDSARPIKSVGLCGNLSAGLGVGALGVGGCIVADSKGVGFTGSTRAGAEVGAGGHAGLGVQVSSADIEDLEGYSANVGGTAVAGIGIEGSGGVSLDGKNNSTYYGGVAFGAEGSAGVNGEYTKSFRPNPAEVKDAYSERKFGR